MNIKIANAVEVDAIWPRFSVCLQEACERTGGDISSGELWQMCRSGNAFLIIAFDDDFRAACIVQFQKWSKPVLRVLGLVGMGMGEWLAIGKDFLWSVAKENGAKSVVFEGRDGWKVPLPEARRLRVTYEVDL